MSNRHVRSIQTTTLHRILFEEANRPEKTTTWLESGMRLALAEFTEAVSGDATVHLT